MRRARVIFRGDRLTATAEGQGLRLDDGRYVAEEEVTWLPPVEPRTIFAVGLNYAKHARELAFAPQQEPLVFLKGPNAVAGHRACTARPADVKFMHYECELAVVIGRPARRVASDAALAHVAGYTVANDYAVRDYLENYYRPNLRAKNRDGATLLGPWLVDASDIADPMNLELRTTVNGTVTQHGNTRDMILDVGAPHRAPEFLHDAVARRRHPDRDARGRRQREPGRRDRDRDRRRGTAGWIHRPGHRAGSSLT